MKPDCGHFLPVGCVTFATPFVAMCASGDSSVQRRTYWSGKFWGPGSCPDFLWSNQIAQICHWPSRSARPNMRGRGKHLPTNGFSETGWAMIFSRKYVSQKEDTRTSIWILAAFSTVRHTEFCQKKHLLRWSAFVFRLQIWVKIAILLKLNHTSVNWTQICFHQSSPCTHLCKFISTAKRCS